MPSAVVAVDSADTGRPSQSSAILSIWGSKSASLPPVLAYRDGLVVTPARQPQLLASAISSRLAVSIKNFMVQTPSKESKTQKIGQRGCPFVLCARACGWGHAPGPASCRKSYLVLESLLDAARDALEVKTDDVLLDRALDVLDHQSACRRCPGQRGCDRASRPAP